MSGDNPEEGPGMSNKCVHAKIVPAYSVPSGKGTLVVENRAGATLVEN